MSVKTENVEQEKENVVDDMEDIVVEEKDAVEDDKMAALKAMMAKKDAGSEPSNQEDKMPPKIVRKRERSMELGIVGSGEAGCRLAESFYELGYTSLAFNTAQTDLDPLSIPEANKYLFEYGLGGAAKERSLGLAAAEAHRDMIRSAVMEKLDDAHVFVFCTSLGGGSGSGSIDTMIDVLSSLGKPVVVMTVLPMASEDASLKKNALEALSTLTEEVKNRRIHNLIVVDNAKIETIFSDVTIFDFFSVSNKAIVEPLDVFNTFSAKKGGQKGIDSTEFMKILINGGGLSLYGSTTVSDYEEDVTALAQALVHNLTSGLLAEGFDLKQTKYVGAMFLANERVWNKLPQGSINYAMSIVEEHAGTPETTFKGMYKVDDMEEDVVKVYSFFSGLALPDQRIDELKEEVKRHNKTLKDKEVNRNMNLTVETDSKAVSAAEKVHEKMKQASSPFSQFQQQLVNKRKKK